MLLYGLAVRFLSLFEDGEGSILGYVNHVGMPDVSTIWVAAD